MTSELTIVEHLNELRARLFKVALVFAGAASAGFLLRDSIVRLLVKPLGDRLVYTSPGGGFNFTLDVILLVGLVITTPFLLHETLRFIEPALTKRTRLGTLKVMALSTLLAITGVMFAYFLTMPPALEFLKGFASADIQPLISTDNYMSFVGVYLGGFALLFQIPLLLWIINRVTPLSPGRLMSYQKYVILGAFILAAVLTPTPDPMNQTAMAGPIIMLYQMGIGVVWAGTRRTNAATLAGYTPVFQVKEAYPVPVTVVEPLADI